MAVAREVFEEVGVRCREVRYLGDQPWPFPASLMLGFEARTDDPELRIDNDEIAEAHWVTRAQYREKLASGEWGRRWHHAVDLATPHPEVAGRGVTQPRFT
jgi:NAD+ diphosphatase